MRAGFVSWGLLALAACSPGGAIDANTASNAAAAIIPANGGDMRADSGPAMAPPTVTAQAAQASVQNPMPEGFYRLQDLEGDWDGAISVLCYARGEGNEMIGERVSYSHDPYPCGPITRSVTAEGWTLTQACNVNQGHTTYTVTARREPNGDYTTRVVGLLDDGTQPPNDHPRSQRLRRVGDCPEGWRRGDFLSLTAGRADDGVYRAHRILHNDDIGPTFDELPAYLTALMPR